MNTSTITDCLLSCEKGVIDHGLQTQKGKEEESEKIDVAMTATRRPEVIRRTLDSFVDNVFKTTDNFRLIINVDPIGLPIQSMDIIDIVREYFDDIIFNLPDRPDFNTAFRYVLSTASSNFVFHLQDDWRACCPVDINEMIEILKERQDLALLRLSMFKSNKDYLLNWDKHKFPWNGKYFECPHFQRQRLGFCGHPSLIKNKFLKLTIPVMDKKHNPENQFHSYFRVVEEVQKWKYGVYMKQSSSPNIEDIGRDWMQQNNWKKNSDKSHTVWHHISSTTQQTATPSSSRLIATTRRRHRMSGITVSAHGQI